MWHYDYYQYVDHVGRGPALLLLALYFAPAIMAFLRGHLSRWAILILNLVFGWTFIGWIVALIWSLTGNTERNRGLRS